MGLPKRPRTKTESIAYYIHDKILHKKLAQQSFQYGELRAILNHLKPGKQTRDLTFEYRRQFRNSLENEIRDNFTARGYADKLIKIIDKKTRFVGTAKGPVVFSWPGNSVILLETRLTKRSLWPKKLPPNIKIYTKSESFYKQFRNWGLWFLKNHSVLFGSNLKGTGINITRPGSGQYTGNSPLPKTVNDQNYGDLEFFKDLHSQMNLVITNYKKKTDLPHRDVFGHQELQKAKSRIARRCLPQAKAFLALFKQAKNGDSGKTLLKFFQDEVNKLEGWRKEFGHLK